MRRLLAPPASLCDVLEPAMLGLMGQTDTSWNTMKGILAAFCAKAMTMTRPPPCPQL